MERYDIRDEYELHNLLKKLWAHGHYNDYLDDAHRMTFGRMPTLKIGHTDRKNRSWISFRNMVIFLTWIWDAR